jgi:PPOX class probable F420-dependent enzyme
MAGKQAADAPLSAAAWQYLEAHRLGHLATVGECGDPSVVPICYAVDRQAIYSALDEKPKRVAPMALRRVRDLLAHAHVALVVDDYAEDWTKLAFLQVRGSADLLQPGTPGHAAAIALLRARYPQYATMAIERRPLIRIRPTHSTFWRATPATGAGRSAIQD